VFDTTEALTAIDVNSSRSTKGKHIDDTALDTNLEAAREIARQLRIRDIGGLIVIDFIDMATRKHGQQVEETLREACKTDKARVQFARISRFGLLEMSRQRLRSSIRESTTEVCPRCNGRGRVRVVESMALQMLTRMEDHAEAGKKPVLIVQVPKATGEYLMNNKRQYIARIEEIYDVQINLQIRPDLEIPHYRIERQWADNGQQRTEVLEDTLKGKKPQRTGRKLKPGTPIVGIPSAMPEPEPDTEAKSEHRKAGLLARIAEALLGKAARRKQQEEEERRKREEEEAAAAKKSASRKRGGRRRRGGRGRRGGQGGGAPRQQATTPRETGATDGEPKQTARNQPAEANTPATGDTKQPAKTSGGTNPDDGPAGDKPDAPATGSSGNRRRRRRRRRPRGNSAQAQTDAGAPQTPTDAGEPNHDRKAVNE